MDYIVCTWHMNEYDILYSIRALWLIMHETRWRKKEKFYELKHFCQLFSENAIKNTINIIILFFSLNNKQWLLLHDQPLNFLELCGNSSEKDEKLQKVMHTCLSMVILICFYDWDSVHVPPWSFKIPRFMVNEMMT